MTNNLINNEQWQGVMKNNAKTFFLASLFFPKHLFNKVRGLYALCRWIDDAADEAPSTEKSRENLFHILADLHSNPSKLIPNQIYKTSELDPGYVEDLIEGATDDLNEVRIKDESHLIQYCYKVAGTVGLAMSDLMGVKDPKARAFAVDLGIAMQITNICRDVKEDAKNGRVYFPQSILTKYGVSAQQLLQLSVSEEAISLATREMLVIADKYYFSAKEAYVKIPWRVRGAIIIASRLYRGIGEKLLKRGGNPLLGRTYLRRHEKALLIAKSLGEWTIRHLKDRNLIHNSALHAPLRRWKALRGFPS